MTLTIEVTPEEETRLRQMAAARGEDQSQFVTHALRTGVAALAAQDSNTLDPEAVAGIREGLMQMDNSQGRPFAEFVAEVQAAREAP